MLEWFPVPFDWCLVLFFLLGLVAGRVGAVFVEAYSKLGEINKDFFSFFLKCQSEWKYIPCSWFVGKVKGWKLPFRPFVIEILMAVLFTLLFYFIGWKYVLLEYLIFTFALVVASAIDMEQMILPDLFTLSGIVIGLMGAILNPESEREFWPALAGVLMGGGFLWFIAVFYYAVRKEEGLGGGDIKLLAWIGAVLTWRAVPFVIILSCFIGLFAGIIMMFHSKDYLKQSIPFGPYLAFSALIYIFCGKTLASLYLSFFYM